MDIIITPKKLNGTIRAVDSKSHAHRLLIAAAMAIAGADISCAGSFSDLADDMISDKNFPGLAEHDVIKCYLEGIAACDDALSVFENLWKEYERARS